MLCTGDSDNLKHRSVKDTIYIPPNIKDTIYIPPNIKDTICIPPNIKDTIYIPPNIKDTIYIPLEILKIRSTSHQILRSGGCKIDTMTSHENNPCAMNGVKTLDPLLMILHSIKGSMPMVFGNFLTNTFLTNTS